ncbi:MAG TPA: aromatic ring-hydroxylating dioxygenase subunit alpha [Acidimicrobiales bacterium]|jgi:vanillate O-demethylase monooxygenase subunit
MSRALSNTDPALRHCWHPVARPAEVTDQPTRFMLLGEPWVLYRSGGDIVAFADRCPHRRTPLSIGRCKAGVLECAYHGWRFDSSGSCVEIPALGPGATLPPAARLSRPAGLVEAHGLVFLAPEEPIAPLGSIPEAADPSFAEGILPTFSTRGSAGLLADNFLDVAHFPFVHAGTFGADEAAEVPPYVVARDDWSFTMSYEHSFANREDPAVAAGTRPLVQTRRLAYRLSAPFHLSLRIDFVEAGGSNVIGFFIQPETADSCRLFTTLWRDDLAGDAGRMAEAVDFEVAVLREDMRIQESFSELVLPLAPTAEVHTRADRTTLELRRVLSDLVAVADGLTG